MAKDSFILYLEQQEVFEMLSDEQAGQLIKNIFQYERTGQMPQMDKMLNLAFIPIMQKLDKNRIKYEDKCQKNKENIQKRWNKNNTNVYECKKSNTNYTDNEYDNDYEYDNDNDNKQDIVSDSCVDGLQDVIDFYNNNVGQLTPYGMTLIDEYVKEMGKDVVIYAMQISVEADKRSIQYIKAILNNWSKKGIKTLAEAQKESQRKPKKADTQEFNQTSSTESWDELYDN